MRSVALVAGLVCSVAQAVVLYDGATGSLAGPSGNSWLAYSSLDYSKLPAFVTPDLTSSVAGGTQLTTTGNFALSAGWSNRYATGTLKNAAFPTLDPSSGFHLDFRLQVADELGTDDRGGFSVILLGSNQRGVEIHFHENSIFALKLNAINQFERDETQTANHDTTPATLYRLAVLGSQFTLSSGGATILTGGTYDYTAWTPTYVWMPDPYAMANYIFLGDNTTSASSTSILSFAAVPEPAGCAAAAIGGLALLRRKRT